MSDRKSNAQQRIKERREKARQSRKRKRLFTIIGFILGTILFIGILFYQSLNPMSTLIKPGKREHPSPNGNTLGDPDAPVKIVEYAEFKCAYCAKYWRETEPELIEEYVSTGKASYTFRIFLPSVTDDAQLSAEAVYCAGDQGKFWEMRDVLFANYYYSISPGNSFSEDVLRQLAKMSGADPDIFSSCLSERKYQEQVNQDIADARAMDVDATPYFFINGESIRGAYPLSEFQQIIDRELASIGQ